MNLIVSDFDGTFFDDNYEKNIEFINSCRDKNNFVIATGRNFNYLKTDLKIKCDYYICNDGGYILDSKENIIYKNIIEPKTVNEIYSRILKLNYKEYYFDNIISATSRPTDNIDKIFIRLEGLNNIKENIKYLIDGLDDIYAYKSTNWINIMSINSNKDKAIDYLVEHNNFDNVYVIGNDVNDYAMIKRYNGYLITNKSNNDFNCVNSFMDLKNIIEND